MCRVPSLQGQVRRSQLSLMNYLRAPVRHGDARILVLQITNHTQPRAQQSGEPSLFCFLLGPKHSLRDSRRPSRCRQYRGWVEWMQPFKSPHGASTHLHSIIPQTTLLQDGPFCTYKLKFSSPVCEFFSEGIIDNFLCQGRLTALCSVP